MYSDPKIQVQFHGAILYKNIPTRQDRRLAADIWRLLSWVDTGLASFLASNFCGVIVLKGRAFFEDRKTWDQVRKAGQGTCRLLVCTGLLDVYLKQVWRQEQELFWACQGFWAWILPVSFPTHLLTSSHEQHFSGGRQKSQTSPFPHMLPLHSHRGQTLFRFFFGKQQV